MSRWSPTVEPLARRPLDFSPISEALGRMTRRRELDEEQTRRDEQREYERGQARTRAQAEAIQEGWRPSAEATPGVGGPSAETRQAWSRMAPSPDADRITMEIGGVNMAYDRTDIDRRAAQRAREKAGAEVAGKVGAVAEARKTYGDEAMDRAGFSDNRFLTYDQRLNIESQKAASQMARLQASLATRRQIATETNAVRTRIADAQAKGDLNALRAAQAEFQVLAQRQAAAEREQYDLMRTAGIFDDAFTLQGRMDDPTAAATITGAQGQLPAAGQRVQGARAAADSAGQRVIEQAGRVREGAGAAKPGDWRRDFEARARAWKQKNPQKQGETGAQYLARMKAGMR